MKRAVIEERGVAERSIEARNEQKRADMVAGRVEEQRSGGGYLLCTGYRQRRGYAR